MTVHANISKRAKSRARVLMTATIVTADAPHRVLVRDISRHGAQVYADDTIAEGQDACFQRGSIFVAARVAWCRNNQAGLEFYRELSSAEVDGAFHPAVLRQRAG